MVPAFLPVRSRSGLHLSVLAVAAVFAGLLGAAGPSTAEAHPSGNYSINRYVGVSLYQHAIQIRYIADYSEIPSLQWLISNDTDDDGAASESEMRAYLADARGTISHGLNVSFDGAPVSLEPLAGVGTFAVSDLGAETLRVEFTFRAAVAGGYGTLVVEDKNFAGVRGWRTVTLHPSQATTFSVIDEELLLDLSEGLTAYPSKWQTFPPTVDSAEIEWDPRTGESLAGVAVPTSDTASPIAPRPSSASRSGILALCIALVVAFATGLVDALGPGHGKTIVAAYLVSADGGLRRAGIISAAASLTHAASAISLGLIAAAASAFVLPERFDNLQAIAGTCAIVGGVAMLALRRSQCEGHGPAHKHRKWNGSSGAVVVGVVGGLVPCPTSVVLMLSAVAIGDVWFGALLAVAFSFGTGFALLAIGLGGIAVRRSALSRSKPGLGAWLTRALPFASAGLMIVTGVVMIHQAATGSVL